MPSDETNHEQLQIQNYAHASSPIRRYVDIINQFALKDKEFSYQLIDRFNKIQKYGKQFERDLIYINLYNNKKILDGIIIDSEKVYIELLKKIINLKNSNKTGEKVRLNYYMNPQGFRWKDKIIFQIIE